MKIAIAADLCSGHGRCAAYAPDVFKLDDDGYNADRGKTIDVPPGAEADARAGVDGCPEWAMTIID